ncbi:hypothetical protein [Citricoccus sp. K5]|uniref:hypothetical protein n=1 Tax=Citricoccus sp. K5 TaxID=2653135 RepID=UPI0012F3AF4C|nr:hypothetical protein [Citricoccus sp. K5]VXB05339.1 conserved hypothetical protein [Citricoccus sp. K5]
MSDEVRNLDDRQKRIFEALVEKERADLADLYRSALDLLASAPEENTQRTRISYICHSMREVMNRVLGAMGNSASPRIRPSTDDQVQVLPNVVAQYPDLALDAEGESIPVPQAVAEMFDKLIKTAIQEKRRSRDDVAALLTDDDNSEHAAVTRWIESRTFFVKWAHLHGTHMDVSELPGDDVIRDHINVFDELFDGVITGFFTLSHSIEDLLAEINAPVMESGDE